MINISNNPFILDEFSKMYAYNQIFLIITFNQHLLNTFILTSFQSSIEFF